VSERVCTADGINDDDDLSTAGTSGRHNKNNNDDEYIVVLTRKAIRLPACPFIHSFVSFIFELNFFIFL
jgi:hypothetical protein